MAHSRALKRVSVLFVAVLALGCASAEGPEAGPAPAADAGVMATPELVAEGQDVFGGAGRCSVCHGAGAVGGRFGPDLTDAEWAWIDPASPNAMGDLTNLIRTGITEPQISDTGMPPMGGGNLSDGQLNALAAYILSL